MEADEHGRDDGAIDCGDFWDEAEAVAERDRLSRLTTDEHIRYLVVETEVTVVYPDDEPPPWVPDPDLKKRRGYDPHGYG